MNKELKAMYDEEIAALQAELRELRKMNAQLVAGYNTMCENMNNLMKHVPQKYQTLRFHVIS